jgi:hypothetical protein
MRKNFLMTMICLCLALFAKAEATDVSQIDNTIYAESMSCAAGTSFTMSVKMKNTVAMTGFQFDLELPTGVSVATDVDDFYIVALSEERTTDARTNYFDNALQKDGSIRIMASSTKNYTFSGNDGEVATIKVNVANMVADGKYPIILKNIVLSDAGSNSYENERVEVTLTVGDEIPTYDEGYSVSIAPFTATSGKAYTIALNFDAKDENITDIEFDMELPSIISRTKSGRVTKAFDSANEERMYVSGTEGDHTITINGNHVAIKAIATDEYKYIAGTSGALVNMYYTSASTLSEGIYPVRFRNVTLTDGDGNILKVAPTTSYIKVGNPTDASLDVEGYVSSDLNSALASETAITSLDMGKVTSMDGSLTIIDGRSFVAPKKTVKVKKVSYSRNMSYKWGTICLPFDIKSNKNIQYYELSRVDNVAGVMSFTPVSLVTAGTPVVFKLLSGTTANITANNAEISAGNNAWNATVNGETWVMKGTMTAKSVDPSTVDGDIYYIAEDKFWYGNMTFPVAAFRGWFEAPKSANAKNGVFSIDIDNMTTGIKYVENNDGTLDVIFDISGRKIEMPKSGINIINGKKVIVK